MIKKSLLLTLLLAILAPWAAQAQETVTIGDGTSTSRNVPIGTYYNYSITEQLYTADEIGTAGTISSISFNYAVSTAKDFPIAVYMMNTDAADLSTGISLADAELVFDGTLSVTGPGWATITLDTPFAYDGTSNLLIGINKGYVYYYNDYTWYCTAASNMTRYSENDNSAYNAATASFGNASSNRPNIQIVIEPASTSGCEKPDELTANGEPTDTEFSFNIVGGSGLYNIFTKAGDGDWTNWEYEWDNTEVNLTNLESNTAYQVRVQSVCTEMTDPETGDAATSGWKTLNFTTKNPCAAPTNLQVSDITAESATLSWTAGYQETEWTVKFKKSADAWDDAVTITATSPSITLTGLDDNTTYNVQVYNCENYVSASFTTLEVCPDGMVCIGSGSATNVNLPLHNYYKYSLTEQIYTTAELGAAGAIESIDFYKAATIETVKTIDIYMVSTTKSEFTGNTDWINVTAADLVFSGTVTFADNDWTTIVLDNPFIYDGLSNVALVVDNNTGSYKSNTAFLTFSTGATYQALYYSSDSQNLDPTNVTQLGTRTYSKNRIRVAVGEPPACLKPTGLTASNVTAHEATITWTSDAAAWEIQLNDETPVEVSDTATYTFDGLDAETTYSVKVRANCGGIYSEWANVSFTTSIACPAPTALAVTPNAYTATFTWESFAGEWDVAYATDATADPEEFIVGTVYDTASYTVNDLELGDYYFWVRANCGNVDGNSTWAGPASVHIGYCVPNPSTRDGKGITKVIFGTGDYLVNNVDETNGLPAASPFYGDYSSMVGAMQAGVESTISITYATGSGTVYSYGTIIWVDWDNSLSFEDSEIVYTGTSAQGSGGVPQVLEASFTVPGNQATGQYRMRIAGADSYFDSYIGGTATGNHSACFSSSYAVCHDYTLRVLAAPSCLIPTDLTIDYTGGTEATISWTSDAEAWNMRVNGVDVNGVITNPYTLTGLELATTYSVEVQANCGEDGTSEWSNPVSFTTDLCLPENQCELTFVLTDSYGDGWNGAYIDVVDVATGESLAHMSNQNLSKGDPETETYTLTVCDGRELQFVWYSGSYDSEASYVVTDINGEEIFSGSGAMSEPVNYTVNCTVNPCRVPTDLAASEISTFKADLSWTGYHDAYNLQYRRPAAADPTATTATVILTAGDVWGDGSGYQMLLDADATAYGTIIPETVSGYGYISTDGTIGGSTGDVASSVYDEFEYKIPVNADGALATENIVINDTITIEIPAGTYDWCITNPTSGDRMWIASSNGNVGGRYNDFVFEAGLTYEFTISNYGSNDGVDVTITPMDEWILVENLTDPSYNLTGLDAKTMYEWQVQGISDDCENGVTEWSAISSFFTDKAYYWNDPQTWTNDSVPAAYADVTIPANTQVIIPSGYTAYADEITIEEGGQIIMEPGAQLYHSNEIPVALQMQNDGYPESKDAVGGFHMIASPVNESVSIASTGLVSGEFVYDLYYFDQAGDEMGNEWINYNQGEGNAPGFTELYIKKGYLYASEDTIKAVFAGSTLPTNAPVSVELDYVEGKRLAGWNLVGNPFTCMAITEEPCYTLNDQGSAIANIEGFSVEVMEGVFVKAEESGQTVTFRTTDGGEWGGDPIVDPDKGNLVLNLSHNNNFIDRAIVRFDEGRQLPKLQLNPNSTEVFIPVDGVDYAIVNATEMGEMPVSFKAAANDTYTLSFSSENVGFNYLHLIDNMTGTDVNLLANPSYSFKASTTDYATRFKLVFATGSNSEDNFAFFSNGNFVISNEGEATLQVIDVTGRIIKSETINGSASVNVKAATGVYMLRLINGNDVKVQKVVVR